LSRALEGKLKSHPESDVYMDIRPVEKIYLEGFDAAQLLAYLQKHPIKQTMDPREIIEKLFSSVHLAEIAKHPLLLNMILETGTAVFERSETLDLGELYRIYTEHWLGNDAFLSSREFTSPALKREFVEDVAVSVLRVGVDGGVFLEDVKDLDGKHDWAFLRNLIGMDSIKGYQNTRSFLLINYDNSIMFAHRSFGEYFCATIAVRLLRQQKALPTDLLPLFYSNLIIWFMRSFVNENDIDWLLSLSKCEESVYLRRLAYSLLPAVSKARKQEIINYLDESFISEPDMEARRHILYGIGWLGGDPYKSKFLDVIKNNQEEWLHAPIPYYHSYAREREHCIRRLIAFKSGDKEFFMNRGLYILDLGKVGELDDIELIKPYSDSENEEILEVRQIAADTIRRIIKRNSK